MSARKDPVREETGEPSMEKDGFAAADGARDAWDLDAQLRAMSVELTLVEERERHRLAHDLHDGLGQTLAAIRLKLDDLPVPIDGVHAAQLRSIRTLVRRAGSELHALTFELCPPTLLGPGLMPALQWLREQMRRDYGLKVRLLLDGPEPPLSEAVAAVLYRAIRELLSNVRKHAGVFEADLDWRGVSGGLVITVSDAGRGFNPAKVRLHPGAGFGLFAVRERLRHLGGELAIDSAPGKGTRAALSVPDGQGTKIRGATVQGAKVQEVKA